MLTPPPAKKKCFVLVVVHIINNDEDESEDDNDSKTTLLWIFLILSIQLEMRLTKGSHMSLREDPVGLKTVLPWFFCSRGEGGQT